MLRMETHWRAGTAGGMLDRLRRMLTRGLQIEVSWQGVHRGEEIETLVTMSRSRGLGDLEVGLVCTESYDYLDMWTDNDGEQQQSRKTAEAVAYEAWQPLESVMGAQSVRLRVPPEGPFSYKGGCLSFKWEVVARGHKKHALDTRAAQEVSVLP